MQTKNVYNFKTVVFISTRCRWGRNFSTIGNRAETKSFGSTTLLRLTCFLAIHLVQNQSWFSAGSLLIPTHSQWYLVDRGHICIFHPWAIYIITVKTRKRRDSGIIVCIRVWILVNDHYKIYNAKIVLQVLKISQSMSKTKSVFFAQMYWNFVSIKKKFTVGFGSGTEFVK